MKENEEPGRSEMSPAVTVLAQYMARFCPTDNFRTPGTELKTTDDIINDLSSMCDLEPNDVVAFLVSAGYRTYYAADGGHGWMLVRLPIDGTASLSTKKD